MLGCLGSCLESLPKFRAGAPALALSSGGSVLDRGVETHTTGQYSRPKRPQKRKDATADDFSYPPYTGPWNQDVRSSCLCGLWYARYLVLKGLGVDIRFRIDMIVRTIRLFL